jgi:hypothetical protein
MRGPAFAALLALSACSTPQRAQAPAAPTADTCGATALQHLVGKPRSEIPPASNPGQRRVACTTCAITMDYSEKRLNIFFDEQTGIIKEVRCG